MSRYELVVNQKGFNGQLIKDYIKEQYQNHKYTFELSRNVGSTQSRKLAQAGCYVWGSFYNNDIAMYKKWKKKLMNQLNEMMNDLMFSNDKRTGIVQIDSSLNRVITGTNNSQGLIQFGAYMKEVTEAIDLMANCLLWN
jgi:hypothetical protein